MHTWGHGTLSERRLTTLTPSRLPDVDMARTEVLVGEHASVDRLHQSSGQGGSPGGAHVPRPPPLPADRL
eukprot:768163-Hanusia_phi.AAC.2